MRQFDAIVIGFGKGGKTLAGYLALKGKKTALIERSEMMYGGTCINVGCIPSKSLVTSAKKAWELEGGYERKAAFYAAAVDRRGALTSALRKKNFDKVASSPNAEVLTGRAEFTGEKTVLVSYPDGSSEELSAPQIFINTGSSPVLPPIEGLSQSRFVYVSETLMSLRRLPERLVIIGGGYIGMEFASMYSLFGSKVTVVQDSDVFLPREDEEISAAVLSRLKELGVEVIFGAKTRQVEDFAGYALVHADTPSGEKVLKAEAVLVAAGRRIDAAGLHPEKAGVELTARGAVKTDEHLRTTAEGIWAMGDVVGGLQFTYISLDDYRIVRSALEGDGLRTTLNRGAVPYSVFLDPPFSRVGLSEKQALEAGHKVKIGRLPAAAIPKANVLGEKTGLLKAVVDADTGEILGAHLFCAESHEMINTIKLAMDAGLKYTALRDQIFTHPTMSEALNDLFAL